MNASWLTAWRDLRFPPIRFPPIRFDRKWTCLIGNGFSILKIWQAYLVPIRKDGRHTLSLTKLRWQACLVPFVIDMASIPGRTRLVPNMTKMASILSPPLYKNCSQITSIANSRVQTKTFWSKTTSLFKHYWDII